ncbi:hypothetical protein SK128_012136, partial [Halocaridina rubra]
TPDRRKPQNLISISRLKAYHSRDSEQEDQVVSICNTVTAECNGIDDIELSTQLCTKED